MSVHIDKLAHHPYWLHQVVEWLHGEWLRYSDELDSSEMHIAERLSERKAAMKQHLGQQPVPTTFLAYEGEHLMGAVSLVRYASSIEPDRVWLTNLYVDVPFQGEGLGTRLLYYAEEFAATIGLAELSLYTFEAKDFYAQRGWNWLTKGELHGRAVDVFSKSVH